MNRGVEKRRIFMKKMDYSRFTLGLEFFNRENINTSLWQLLSRAGSDPAGLSIGRRLGEERERGSKPLTEVLGFALMPNHYHLLLKEIQPGGISEYMKRMGGYSTYFNKQYKRVGGLFQGRYKSVEITDDAHAKTAFVYVHTNPVELVEKGWKNAKVRNPQKALKYLKKYPWTSYSEYVGKPQYSGLIDTKFYLDIFGGKRACQRAIEQWIAGKRASYLRDTTLP